MEINDVVYLKGLNPVPYMLVSKINLVNNRGKIDTNLVECIWYDKHDRLQRDRFNVNSLIVLEKS